MLHFYPLSLQRTVATSICQLSKVEESECVFMCPGTPWKWERKKENLVETGDSLLIFAYNLRTRKWSACEAKEHSAQSGARNAELRSMRSRLASKVYLRPELSTSLPDASHFADATSNRSCWLPAAVPTPSDNCERWCSHVEEKERKKKRFRADERKKRQTM